ncbi:MAG: DNA polymerase I [Bacteroidales bacterium]|nr:DNA polymerase I [Bacteroidales bacterium]
MKKKLYLIDAMGLIFRAYYAMMKSPRYTTKGLNTSAILGFTNSLYEILKKEQPTHVAVAFDTGAPTFRHAEFENYKANREATPDDIILSVPYIKRILEAFRIAMVSMDGYEADDVVGSLAKHAEIEGFEVYMVTSDKDYGQLVSEHIHLYRPGKFGQPAEILGVKEVCEKYKIEDPEQLIDMLGLWGDSSDNIPGVPGIGQVRAQKLLATYHSIEEMYERGADQENEKMRNLLMENKEQALLSKQLATIMLDVPLDYDFNQMALTSPNIPELKAVFAELEFKALTQRVLKDLKVSDSASDEVDLFSQTTEQNEEELPCCQGFAKKTQLFSLEDLPDSVKKSDRLFFDWIMKENRIAGFVLTAGMAEGFYHFVESEHRHYQALLSWIFTGEHEVALYDYKQTYKFLTVFKIKPNAKIFDLLIAHYLIQPESKHTLEMMVEYMLEATLTKPEQPQEQSALERVGAYVQLYPLLIKAIQEGDLQKLFEEVEMPLSSVLANMEMAGVKLDVPTLQKNSEAMQQELQDIEKQIYEYAGVTFNIGSPKQLGEVLFEKLRLVENAKLTKSKQYQTGEEVLLKLAPKHPIVPLILEWRKLSKLKSTYIDALPALINPKDGRIHTTFTQTITATGRLSSVNPNLQNIPIRTERGRDIRKAFVAADDDHVLLAADYSQIELRIVAHVCGDERMIKTFRRHEDIHASMAAHVYGVPQEEVTKDMRRNAKTVNFGILYGISAFGLADRLQIPQYEARQLIADYFKSFPKINDYLNSTLDFAREHLYVETLLGRRRYIRDINAHNAILRKSAERNAINAPIQGTAADLIKIAMIRIQREMDKLQLRSRMILQVHDELVFDTLKEELDTMRELVRREMMNAMQLDVPLDVDINDGHSWFDAH